MKIKFLSFVIFLGITLTVFSQKKAELRYQLDQGNHFKITMKIDQTIDMEVQGQQMKMDQEISFFMSIDVMEVYKDSLKLSSTINRVIMSQNMMGNQMTFDSDDTLSMENPMTAQMNNTFRDFLEKSIIQVMDNRGNVLRVDLGELAGNESFAQNFGSVQQFIIFPEDKIKIGDSWENEIKPIVDNGIYTKAKYTLADIESGKAKILFEGLISSPEGDELSMQMNGDQSGEMYVDIKTGWVITSTTNQKLDLVITQNGMSIPAKVNSKVVTNSGSN